jgi:hypothetical protein
VTPGAPWQVLADCPHCRTEAAVIELMDPSHPACAFGVPSDRRCRMCGWQEVAAPLPGGSGCPRCRGELADGADACPACGFVPTVIPVTPPANLRDAARALAALEAWAAEEGEADLGVFARGSFGAEPEQVVARLVAGEVVPSTFDVIAFLFPSSGGAAVQRSVERRVVVVDPEPQQVAEASMVPGVADPRTPARVLVSVMVADGTLRAGERRFIVQFLNREGLPPLSAEDLRVWRPSELGPAPDPAVCERVIEAAVHLMHLDRERDGSEWRVIRTFARAWGIEDHRLDRWDRAYDRRYRSTMSRLGELLARLFR